MDDVSLWVRVQDILFGASNTMEDDLRQLSKTDHSMLVLL